MNQNYPIQIRKIICSLAFILLCIQNGFSQNGTVSGKIVDPTLKTGIPGVTVKVMPAGISVLTNADGEYSIPAKAGDKLEISCIGYLSQSITVTDAGIVNFEIIASANNQLNEVVVTALGIKKEKKKLGYAVQDLSGDALTVARETNVVNQLAGKVAGVTVVGSNSGVGGSSRVTIRGERSLNLNKNEPLYVVDGVPISNSLTGGSGRGNLEVDFGNGAGFVNPDDIESMSVLKGPAAAALYGARAANGVIMIKTKSGSRPKGLGVEINSNITLETALKLPKYQTVYGQGNGSGGIFDFVDGAGGGTADGTDEGWGPAFKGQLFRQFNSPRTLNGAPIGFLGGDLNAPTGSVITQTPWVADKDNLKNFLQTGQTFTNNVALVGGNKDGDFRISYTNLNQTGIVPNTDLNRNTISLSSGYNFTSKLSARTFVSYIKSTSGNRPSISYGTENIMYLFNCWLPASVKVRDMERLWMPGAEDRRQFSWNFNYHDNPYLTVFENTNSQNVDRLIGNISLSYQFNKDLRLTLRTATDFSTELREFKRAFSTQRFPFGQYRKVTINNEERNSDFLLSYNKKINDDWSFSANAGGNQMKQESRFDEIVAGQLNIPGIFNVTNSRIPLVAAQSTVGKRINSLYGSVGTGWKNKVFLDFTGRNDWSSALTLPKDLQPFGSADNSYFYYSLALSTIISDMVKLPQIISFAKLRGSFSQVGNDTDPFTFTQAFNPSEPFGNSQIYSETDRLANLNLKPEISNAWEIGADVRLLKNRIGIDFTYYTSNTINQILPLPLSNTSGFNTRVINAGRIKNWGFETMLNFRTIQKKNFTWTTDINFSANRSEVVELTDGLTNYVMATRRVSVEARVGERMGSLYGIGFARVQSTDPNAPYYDKSGAFTGQQVFDATTGRPVRTTNRILLGNYNPDWLMGISNSFMYKGVRLSFLFDIRSGGQLYSETQTVGREGGIIEETLEGRADGYDLTKEGNGVIGNGVVFVNGLPQVNTKKVSAREWHTAWTGGRGIAEGVMFDASFVKLRELQFGYTIPDRFWGPKLPLRGVTITLVGRNLFLWDNVPHVDPEVMSFAGGTALPGIENMSIPSAKSYGLNLSIRL